MRKEVRLWGTVLPFLSVFGLFEYGTATKFDQNEWESLGFAAILIRVGVPLLRVKPVRDFLRDLLDSFENNEENAQP